jgi:hypothetical protein
MKINLSGISNNAQIMPLNYCLGGESLVEEEVLKLEPQTNNRKTEPLMKKTPKIYDPDYW